MIFRVILAITALLLILYFGAIGRRHPLQLAGICLTFFLLFIFALMPDISTDIAHIVGIGRGVDLALYLSILFLLSFTFNLYLGLREQSDQSILLARKLARSNPQTTTSPPDCKTLVVVPMYQEEKVIAQVLQELTNTGVTACVIDDGSQDQSVAEVKKLIHLGLPIILIEHPINLGQGAALVTGFEEALSRDTEFVVTFDSDGQHQPQDALHLVEVLKKNPSLDLVLGSRFLGQSQGMPLSRKCLLKAAIIFTYITGGPKLTDSHNGLRAIRRRALPKLKLTQARMAHASEILRLIQIHRLKYQEEPVTIHYTEHSLSKGQSMWGALSIVKDLIISRLLRRS